MNELPVLVRIDSDYGITKEAALDIVFGELIRAQIKPLLSREMFKRSLYLKS